MANLKCPRCGSEKIMPNLRIKDSTGGAVYQDLVVEVQRNPDALIFKKPSRAALTATVCGECGYAVLSVDNPKALWDIYSQQKNA